MVIDENGVPTASRSNTLRQQRRSSISRLADSGVIKTLATLSYYSVATRLPQPPFPGGKFGNWLRAQLCRTIFLQCGRNIVVRKHAFFGSGCDIEIGDHSEIGLNAYLNRDVKIGTHVLMGQNVTILTTNHEFENPDVWIHDQGTRERKPVFIGDDVWIGANSILLPGIRIGNGAVIGAGSVVTRDVPPLAVIAGNPARVIRQRGSKYGAPADAQTQNAMETMNTPVVSIITPVFNSAQWLAEMLASVRNQTFSNWEHLLVDDGSTDGSDQRIERAAEADPRIRLLRMPRNGGPAKARNRAIDEARGQYLAFLDADDLWLEQKLERCLRFMQQNQYPFVYHAFRYLSSDGQSAGALVRGPRELTIRNLHVRRGIGDCMSVIIDRERIPDFRFLSHHGKTHEDWQAWLSLVTNGHTGHLLDEDLGRYRKSDGSRNASKLTAARLVWRLYRHYEKLPWPRAARWWTQYAWNSFWLHLRSRPPALNKSGNTRPHPAETSPCEEPL